MLIYIRLILKSTVCLIVAIILTQNLCKAELDLYEYNYGDLRFIYYGKNYSYLLEHSAKAFTNAFNKHKQLWDYLPNHESVIFIHDLSDFGNGGAVAMPFNFVSVGVNPFDNVYELMPAPERVQWLASHELTHIVMCDKSNETDDFYRTIFFGKPLNDNSNPLSFIYSYLASPRWYSPRWFHEGIAITCETFLNGGFGRTLGGFDEMTFRTMVLDSAYFYYPVGLETEGSTLDFQVGANAYLYGARFDTYLLTRFDLAKVIDFYSRSINSRGFFASQFKNVFNEDLITIWKDWIEYENDFQYKNLELIRQNKSTEFRRILEFGLGSASRQFYSKKDNSIIAAVNYPGSMATISKINLYDGKIKHLTDVISPRLYFVTNIAYSEKSNLIFYTENNNAFRDLVIIDSDTGDEIKRLKNIRIGDPVVNKEDNSIWCIRNYYGRSVICRIIAPYNDVEELYTIPYSYTFFDIDISSDGKILSGTYGSPDGRQKIVTMNIAELLSGKFNFNEIYEFEDNSASNFVFTEDNNHLIGTSYMTGVSNVFRINLENKKAEVITNSETGMFRPIPIANDSIMAYYYSKSGFVPVMFRLDTFCNATSINYLGMKALQNNPELKKWNLPSFSKIVIDKSVISEKSYNSFNNLKLRYMIPVAEGYKDFPAYGLKFKFIDDIYINLIDISFLYSPNPLIPAKERFHSNLKFNYLEWELIGTYNKTDFYDLLGPIKRSRAGYSLSIEYHDYFMYNRKPENADYKIKVFYAGDLQSLPEYQNVNVSTDKLISAIINFNYSFLRKSLGAVDDEQGVDYKLYLSTVAVDNFVIPKIFWEGSFGRLLPFRNSSFWLRLYGGKSFGETSSPYNYFYFGGFGNNYMDMYKICRFRESESFPGLKINEIGSEAFIKSTIEINLPPIRFRKFGFLPFYFTYSRLSIFASGLLLGNQDFSYTTRALSVGCQIDFELSLFYLMKTYLSFGYAMASLENQRATDEFMISLKF